MNVDAVNIDVDAVNIGRPSPVRARELTRKMQGGAQVTAKKKQWAVGDRCYVLTYADGVRRGRVEDLYAREVKLRLDTGFAHWASYDALHVSRDALDVAHLSKSLTVARKRVRLAEKELLAAGKRERLALSQVATLEGKLAVAKARVTK